MSYNEEVIIINKKKGIERNMDREKKEIELLIKSRGFENERSMYKFVPNENMTRDAGTIINGRVEGHFYIKPKADETIIFRKNDFLSAAWRRICSCMGYPYNDAKEIEEFHITYDGNIMVKVNIQTPIDIPLQNNNIENTTEWIDEKSDKAKTIFK